MALEGGIFSLNGRLSISQSDMTAKIIRNGGELVDKIPRKLRTENTFLISSPDSLVSLKAKDAYEKDAHIVLEDFIDECIKQQGLLNLNLAKFSGFRQNSNINPDHFPKPQETSSAPVLSQRKEHPLDKGVFVICGRPSIPKSELQTKIVTNGGKLENGVTKNTTHVISSIDSLQTMQVEKALTKNIPVVSGEYIEACIEQGDLLDLSLGVNTKFILTAQNSMQSGAVKSSQHVPVFSNIVFTVSGRLSRAQNDIQGDIIRNGGRFSDAVTKDTTHVISDGFPSTKVQQAKERGLPIVSEDYLSACIAIGGEINLNLKQNEKYLVQIVAKAEPQEDRKPAPPAVDSGSPEALKGCVFTLTGSYEGFTQNEFKGLIMQNGGKVTDTLTKAVTHVVSSEGAISVKIDDARAKGLPIVTYEFVLASIASKKPLDLSTKKNAAYLIKGMSAPPVLSTAKPEAAPVPVPAPAPAPAKKVFDGKTLALCGRFPLKKSEIQRLVFEQGGEVIEYISNAVSFLVCSEDDLDLMTKKASDALDKQIPIVKLNYLVDCIEKHTLLDLSTPSIAEKYVLTDKAASLRNDALADSILNESTEMDFEIDSLSESEDSDSDQPNTWLDIPEEEPEEAQVKEAAKKKPKLTIAPSAGKDKKPKAPKDPNRPKQPTNAFIFFSNEKKEGAKAMWPNMTHLDRVKWLSDQWNALDETGKKKYSDMALSDRERYKQEMLTYVPPTISEQVIDTVHQKKKKVERDPDQPKKPMNSYLYFLEEKKEVARSGNPQANPKELMKIVGEMWAATADKSKYEAKAEEARKKYATEMEAYEARKGLPSNPKPKSAPTKRSSLQGKAQKPSTKPKFSVGDVVEARWPRSELITCRTGVISQVNPDGSLTITFSDAPATSENVHAECVRAQEQINVGDAIFYKSNAFNWPAGTVAAKNADGTYVCCLMGTQHTQTVDRSKITKRIEYLSPGQLCVGDKIEGCPDDPFNWHHGVVEAIQPDGTYSIRYELYGYFSNVPASRLRLQEQIDEGRRVEAKFSFKTWLPGVVKTVNSNGTFAVQYDNGELQPSVARTSLRTLDYQMVAKKRKVMEDGPA